MNIVDLLHRDYKIDLGKFEDTNGLLNYTNE